MTDSDSVEKSQQPILSAALGTRMLSPGASGECNTAPLHLIHGVLGSINFTGRVHPILVQCHQDSCLFPQGMCEREVSGMKYIPKQLPQDQNWYSSSAPSIAHSGVPSLSAGTSPGLGDISGEKPRFSSWSPCLSQAKAIFILCNRVGECQETPHVC